MRDLEPRQVLRLREGVREEAEDVVVAEEPLEIRVGGTPVVVVMRTPGRDDELAAGFLFTEGMVTSPRGLGAIHYCMGEDGKPAPNVVNVLPPADAPIDVERFRRTFPAGSGCGICGKQSIEQVHRVHPRIEDAGRVRAATILALPERMREGQALFRWSGSIHAAALFDGEGRLVLVREDVGRHNAVDRVVGRMLMEERLPLAGHVLMVSGRVSFEIVQKALAARVPTIAAVSGVTSLALQLAEESGMTLVGFVRGNGFNVYCGAERIEW